MEALCLDRATCFARGILEGSDKGAWEGEGEGERVLDMSASESVSDASLRVRFPSAEPGPLELPTGAAALPLALFFRRYWFDHSKMSLSFSV